MSDLTLNNRALGTTNINTLNFLAEATVHRIRSGQELAALKTAKENGADDLFFSIGQDTFVASGRGLEGIKRGDSIFYKGRRGVVTVVDDQINTAKEGAAVTVIPAIGLIGSPMGVIPAGIVVGLGALYGAIRKVSTKSMETFAE